MDSPQEIKNLMAEFSIKNHLPPFPPVMPWVNHLPQWLVPRFIHRMRERKRNQILFFRIMIKRLQWEKFYRDHNIPIPSPPPEPATDEPPTPCPWPILDKLPQWIIPGFVQDWRIKRNMTDRFENRFKEILVKPPVDKPRPES